MSRICEIRAREILDSRGYPTVEVDIRLESGALGRAAVPSGASTGQREALELRDLDPARYMGKGVRKAIENIHKTIAPKILDIPAEEQALLDRLLIALDGTPNKRVLGANAMLAVSLAAANAAAIERGVPLFQYLGGITARQMPLPMMNVLNGGAHADNGLDIQEFMIVPVGASSWRESLRIGAEVFHQLKAVLKKRGYTTAVGDEGGFAPAVRSHDEALTLIIEAIEASGREAGKDVLLAIDAAASGWVRGEKYFLASENQSLSSDALIDYYADLIDRFPIVSIEDGLSESDWGGWTRMTERLGERVQLVGDDLFVTHEALLSRGIDEGVANAILIKVNQIGTLTETWHTVERAKQAGYRTIVSHRSGETEDVTVSDLAVGFSAGQIKCGSLSRTDRTAKYNQLLRIEEHLGEDAQFIGRRVFLRDSNRPYG